MIIIDTVFVSDTVNIISSKNSKPHIEVIARRYFAVKFSISRIFKGNNKTTIITVMTEAQRCGFQFALNYDYVVYGYTALLNIIDNGDTTSNQKSGIETKTITTEKYTTNSCTRTTPGIKYEISEIKKKKLI